jgi:cytochrome c553
MRTTRRFSRLNDRHKRHYDNRLENEMNAKPRAEIAHAMPKPRTTDVARAALFVAAVLLALAPLARERGARAAAGTVAPPTWAYPVDASSLRDPLETGGVRHVPDSTRAYTGAQLQDMFAVPDWHPGDHPAMPPIVGYGRKPNVYACGYCHRPDGVGGPENASVAGLPYDYIVQQIADFKNGTRRTSVPQRIPPQYMIALSRVVSKSDVEAAAHYFSSLKPKSFIKVVETQTVPATYSAGWFLAADPSRPREPIGHRIIEVPQDLARFYARDSRARFIAYVPVGSVAAGRTLVSGGTSRTIACSSCHGANLMGDAGIPPIAGRSPSYIVRQLIDIQSGHRTGEDVVAMQGVVAELKLTDMIAIAAYLATHGPKAP